MAGDYIWIAPQEALENHDGLRPLRTPPEAKEQRTQQCEATVVAIMAHQAADEIEAQIAAQAMAMHSASLECSRRAMLHEQPYEIAQGFRKAAANSSRIFIELLGALDRKRGKAGQQRAVVEHIHPHSRDHQS